MSKRNQVAYVKPQDPSFLRALKEQIGYKEGPTVDTKRQKLDSSDASGGSYLDSFVDDVNSERGAERADELPQVVVLKAGDLTAEEADAEQKRIEKEDLEQPADLSQRILFKSKNKFVDENKITEKKDNTPKVKKTKTKDLKNKLSFNDQDEDEHGIF